jgi:cytochrome c556
MLVFARSLSVVGLAAATLAACSQSANVAPEIAAAMKARHDGFETIGDAFKQINDALKAGGTLDAELAQAAGTIAAQSTQLIGWFPAGSGPEAGKTEAKAEIWAQPELFAEKRDAFVSEAGKLAALAAAGDAEGFAAQVKAVGGSCKGCHDNFRAKD